MADCMTFPETVDGFFDQYGIWDREEVYTNGALLIPVFRVEQMIDHYFPERTCRSTTDDTAWCFVCSECKKSFPRSDLPFAHNHGEINYCPNCGSKVVEE